MYYDITCKAWGDPSFDKEPFALLDLFNELTPEQQDEYVRSVEIFEGLAGGIPASPENIAKFDEQIERMLATA